MLIFILFTIQATSPPYRTHNLFKTISIHNCKKEQINRNSSCGCFLLSHIHALHSNFTNLRLFILSSHIQAFPSLSLHIQTFPSLSLHIQAFSILAIVYPRFSTLTITHPASTPFIFLFILRLIVYLLSSRYKSTFLTIFTVFLHVISAFCYDNIPPSNAYSA